MGKCPLSLYHHLLIGLPASGKTTFAQLLASQLIDSLIISPDQIRHQLYGDAMTQGDWSEIEAEALRQATQAIADQKSIIYDATNTKRSWRFNWLQKMQDQGDRPLQWIGWWLDLPFDVCIERNSQRDRQVDERVIAEMAANLKAFQPVEGEGFAKVYRLKLKDQLALTADDLVTKIEKVSLSLVRRRSRKSKQDFHRYSHLLDFERLLFTLHFLLHHITDLPPLQRELSGAERKTEGSSESFASQEESPPAPLEERGEPDKTVEVIYCHLVKNHGEVYGDRRAIAEDLAWLEENDFFQCQSTNQALTPAAADPQKIAQLKARDYAGHRYDDRITFERVMLICRTILQHPFIGQRSEFKKDQDGDRRRELEAKRGRAYLSLPFQSESLENALEELGILHGKIRTQIRRDIQECLKPYGLMKNDSAYKQGYFLGTAILSAAELLRLREAIHGNKVYLNDTNITELLDTLDQRLQQGGLELREQGQAIRAIGNRNMIDLDQLHEHCLLQPQPLERLDQAIRAGHLHEFGFYQKTAAWNAHPKDLFRAYPLQLVFFNRAWYLGCEWENGLFCFERMDRIRFNGTKPLSTRSAAAQRESINRLRKLNEATFGVYLGKSVDDQRRYLGRNKLSRKQRAEIETEVEVWLSEWSFSFIKEGWQRFGKGQMLLSKEVGKTYGSEEKKIFTITDKGDEKFPFIMRLKLPKWSVGRCDPSAPEEEQMKPGDIEFLKWILGYRGEIKVVKPDYFVALLRKEMMEMANLYQD